MRTDQALTLPIVVGDIAPLPRVATLTVARVSFEVIASAVFAVVVLSMPELIFGIGLVAMAAERRSRHERGHDMVFA